MEYMTTWEREGLKKGLEQGRQEGRQEGQLATIERLLIKKFGQIEPAQQEQLQTLSLAQLEQLTDVLLDFTNSSDLTEWLKKN